MKLIISNDIYSVFDINGVRLELFAYSKIAENHIFGSYCLASIEVENLVVLKRKIMSLEIGLPLTQISAN